jgi:hypothetical protein
MLGRENARFAWRRRETHSPSTLWCPSSNLPNLIGTRKRLETPLTHRKQKIATRSNRYSSHFIISRPSSTCWSASSVPLPASNLQNLPETANRVETHVTHRKQTIGCMATRDRSRLDSDLLPGKILNAGGAKICAGLVSIASHSALATCHGPKANRDGNWGKTFYNEISRHRKDLLRKVF